jgi:GNAT superfamily N-acetyltransferase
MDYVLRQATLEDIPALEELIAESVRGLSRGDYSDAQIEKAIGTVFGVDSRLILDGTYFIVEVEGSLVGCGGWSKRRTLFGGDGYEKREPELLDPSLEPAKIRAFFVHPAWARRGIGRAVLERCESEASSQGFGSLELMATLPGMKMYAAMGYIEREHVFHDLGDGLMIEFVPMRKELR